jgi:ABC-type bacteriocin/lantibiotic exporter with double-glycine peptidase domain
MTTGSTMNIIIILSQLMTVGIATIGCIMVVYGYINMGGLAACILLAGRIMYPFQRSVTFIYRLNEYESAQDKLNSLLKLHRESYTKTDFDKKLKVEISQLGYQPQEQNKPLFEDINFSHSKPGIIGLRGPEGAGKTCFYKLISGILTPTTGQILINGVDPRHIPEKVYPTTISYISNKSAIFKGTIRENLTFFGSIPWSMAEAVAKKLRIPNSISHLPLGYETQLNDNSSDPISPGIKQRISIARALALSPKIILFDDADTNLDLATLTSLRDHFLKIKNDTIILITTNNPKLQEICEEFYTFKDGKLIKEGKR